MEYTISNGILTARVNARGAELCSLIYEGAEYIWQAGKEWPRSAPVCCPWCGVVDGGKFEHGGRTYAAGRHGFVRDCVHGLVDRSEDGLTFQFAVEGFQDDRWPWPFALTAHYALKADTLALTYSISNAGTETMPLQLGFHPGFIAPEGSAIRAGKSELPGGSDTLHVVTGTFDNDSMCVAHPASDWFALERPDGRSVTLDTRGFDYVLLWGVPGNTPFVCIEPWTGYPGPGGMFDRPGVISLEPGEKMERTLTIKLG